MNYNKMIEWIGTHNVGISSRTMWCALMGVANSETPAYCGFDVPHDWDDFSLLRPCNLLRGGKRRVAESSGIEVKDDSLHNEMYDIELTRAVYDIVKR